MIKLTQSEITVESYSSSAYMIKLNLILNLQFNLKMIGFMAKVQLIKTHFRSCNSIKILNSYIVID